MIFKPTFNRNLRLEFHGASVSSDAGLLAYRELDNTLGLTEIADSILRDMKTRMSKAGFYEKKVKIYN